MKTIFREHFELHCQECERITLHCLSTVQGVEEFKCLWCEQMYYYNRRKDQLWHGDYMHNTSPLPKRRLNRIFLHEQHYPNNSELS